MFKSFSRGSRKVEAVATALDAHSVTYRRADACMVAVFDVPDLGVVKISPGGQAVSIAGAGMLARIVLPALTRLDDAPGGTLS